MRGLSTIPFWGVHIAAVVGVIALGWSWSGVALAVALYYVRMFGITAGYHRYFSHRSYKTSRPVQFLMALLGTLSVQKGVLWWAAHHRRHHKHSDDPADVHSPVQHGFWWAHLKWILSSSFEDTDWDRIRDLSRYPELRFLNKYYMVVVVGFAVALFLVGGAHALVWGFFVSTTLLWHGTFTINSLSHMFGRRRYQTTDDSRNNWALALLTMGEGWHNNHHYYQASARQGFYWWEIDMSYYILRAMAWVGLVHDIKTVPEHVRDPAQAEARRERRLEAQDAELALSADRKAA
jgi:stearoyl-CoA desaturase (Delta-9 desaturase)